MSYRIQTTAIASSSIEVFYAARPYATGREAADTLSSAAEAIADELEVQFHVELLIRPKPGVRLSYTSGSVSGRTVLAAQRLVLWLKQHADRYSSE